MKTSSCIAKLSFPRADRWVRRDRVQTLIGEALECFSTCWIVGPAGTGKTTAVMDYLNTSRKTVFWYRVDEGDIDVASFFYYLIQLAPKDKQGRNALPIFGPEYAGQPVEFARRFFREFFARLPCCVLVFDDLHCAEQTLFRNILAVALSEIPASVRCLCISRNLPFPELSELQLKGQLSTLDHTVLDFTIDEARQLFTLRKVRGEFAEHAHQLASGWAAGLVLIGERIKRNKGTENHTFETQESKTLLYYHLADKVLTVLPAEQQTILLYSSLLPEVSADVTNEFLGREDCTVQLAAIYRRQLFITRRGSRDPIYRYHDLFQDFLRAELARRLPVDELMRLKCRAAHILKQHGYIDAAIELALEGEDWHYACELLVADVEILLNAGRWKQFLDWAEKLPVELRMDHAWLNYWLGVALMVHDDVVAEERFERAHALFLSQKDLHGASATAARVVLSRHYNRRSYVGLHVWIERALQYASADLHFGNQDLGLLVHTGSLRAMEFASKLGTDQAHKTATHMLKMLALPAEDLEVNTRFLASESLIGYSGSDNRPEFFAATVQAVRPYYDHPKLRPWTYAAWLSTFGWVATKYPHLNVAAPFTCGKKALLEAVNIAERERLPGVLFLALYNLYGVSRFDADIGYLTELVKRMKIAMDPSAPVQVKNHEFIQSFLLASQGHYVEALTSIEAALRLGFAEQLPAANYDILSQCFWLTLKVKGHTAAVELLCPHVDLYTGMFHRALLISLDLADAFQLKVSNDEGYPEALVGCLQAARRENWPSVCSVIPTLAAEFFADGLRFGIEPEFCKLAIRRRNLLPPTRDIPHWPWAIKIFALGGCEIEVDGKPAQWGKKPPKKPLELLKMLIAANENVVDAKLVCSSLWPDLDLAATKALSMTVTRLRKLLKRDDAILGDDGKLRLNTDIVWVDVTAFDRRVDEALHALAKMSELHPTDSAEQLLSLYKGTLFGDDQLAAWAIVARERLAIKFLRLATELAMHYERQQQWRQAIVVYEKGLAQDTLREEFYRGMIRCYKALGEPAVAMAVFRRCREVLSIVLGMPPTQATLTLVENIYASA